MAACCMRLTTKTFIILTALIMLLLSIATIGVGVFSISQFVDTFLADAIPSWASYTIFSVGIVLALLSLFLIVRTSFCLHKSKVSLAIVAGFTLIFCAAFSTATAVAFNYAEVMKIAAQTGFSDDVDAGVKASFRGVRDAYVNAYVQCNATSYMTSNVKAACKLQNALPFNKLNVSECANDAYGGGVDRVGVYCRNGPGLEPFTADRVLAFPPPVQPFDTSLDYWRQMRSLGYFMNAVCMPNATRYYDLMGQLITLSIPGIFLPAGVQAHATNSVFSKCYKSTWWGEELDSLGAAAQAAATAQPIVPDGFKALPNGTRLSGERRLFFDALQASRAALLGNPFLSAKLSFCMCTDQGEQSPLFVFLREQIFGHIQWITLALAIFFGLSLLSAIYLGCCVPDADLAESAHPEVKQLRGWQAGQSSGNVQRPESTQQHMNYMVRP